VILDAYKWLVCKLLVDSADRLQTQLKTGHDGFTARNNSQVYYCRTLAIAYVEVNIAISLFLIEHCLTQLCHFFSNHTRGTPIPSLFNSSRMLLYISSRNHVEYQTLSSICNFIEVCHSFLIVS